MRLFRNLKIRDKILLGYAILVAVVLALVANNAQTANESRNLDELVSDDVLPEMAALNLVQDVALKLIQSTDVAIATALEAKIRGDAAKSFPRDMSQLLRQQRAELWQAVNEYTRIESEELELENDSNFASLARALADKTEHLIEHSIEVENWAVSGSYNVEALVQLMKHLDDEMAGFRAVISGSIAHEQHELAEATEDLGEKVSQISLWNLIAAGLAVILSILVSIMIANRIAQQLQDLRTAAERIGKGDLTPRAVGADNDEIGDLERSFVQMADRLHAAHDQISAHRENLEREVQARTAELVNSNNSLKEAMSAANQANIAKSQFLATMSHELRTPLNAIIGFSGMISNETFGPVGNPRYVNYVELIERSGNHLLGIIDTVLDMAKIDMGKIDMAPEVLRPADELDTCLQLVRGKCEESRLTLRCDIDRDACVVADARLFRQIAINLLSNAIKFTPMGGEVSVSCATTPAGMLQLSVADTGIGIPPERVKDVFRPFVQVNDAMVAGSGGLGLGLSLVSKFVELHSGSVDIMSAEGEGTRVTVALPNASRGPSRREQVPALA